MRWKQECGVERLLTGALAALVLFCSQHATAADAASILGRIDLDGFATERAEVEAEIAKAESERFTRDQLLVMMGRSSAAAGHFDLSSAAYLMFLNEYGENHEWSERVAERLLESLAPLNTRSVEIRHTAGGPHYEPQWRMDYTPSPLRLQQAIEASEYVAAISADTRGKARAFFRQGWIQRARNDWTAATKAWDRCAQVGDAHKVTQDALWLAAQNEEYCNRPAQAVERLQRLVASHPEDGRAVAAHGAIERLNAAAKRDEAWLADPVASMKREITERSKDCDAEHVYADVAGWLQRQQQWTALAAVSRWAAGQSGWSEAQSWVARGTLAAALQAEGTPESRAEAQAVLQQMTAATEKPEQFVWATIRLSRLLSDLGRHDDAVAAIVAAEGRLGDASRWEHAFLRERVSTLIAGGKNAAALEAVQAFNDAHPDRDSAVTLEQVIKAASRKEGN